MAVLAFFPFMVRFAFLFIFVTLMLPLKFDRSARFVGLGHQTALSHGECRRATSCKCGGDPLLTDGAEGECTVSQGVLRRVLLRQAKLEYALRRQRMNRYIEQHIRFQKRRFTKRGRGIQIVAFPVLFIGFLFAPGWWAHQQVSMPMGLDEAAGRCLGVIITGLGGA